MRLEDERINFKALAMILLGRSSFASIANISGLKYEIHPKEKSHNDPHCHVSYQGRCISISLTNFSVLEGNLPLRQQKEACKWVEGNIEILRKYWNKYHQVVF